MAEFNLAEARRAGYSDDEIRAFLLNQEGVSDARKAGYSDEDILAHFGFGAETPPQMEGPGRLPAMAASGLAKGAVSTLGLPGEAIDLGNKYLPNWLTRPIFSVDDSGFHLFPDEAPTNFLPTVSQVTDATKALGLTDRADLEPQNEGEKYLRAGAEGAGSAVPFLASGGAALPLLAAGTAGGLGAEGAHELLPDSDIAPVVGGLLGGLGVGSLTSGAKRLLTSRAVSSELSTAQAALESLKAASMPERFAQAETTRVAKLAAQEAFNSEKAAALAARTQAETHAQEAVLGEAKKLAPSTTLQEAGEVAQSHARNWLEKTLPAKVSALWAPVDDLVDAATPVTLDAFESALKAINSSAGSLEALASKLKPALPQGLEKAFTGLKEGQAEGLIAPTTWADVSKLRSTLGDALHNPAIIKDVGAQNLDRLYATLTSDMKSAARGVSPDAETLFNAANEGSRRLYTFAEQHIGKLVSGAKASAEDISGEAAAKALLSSGKVGGSTLAALRAEIPEAIDHLAAAHLNVGDWAKLSPEAKAALVPDAASRTVLDGASGARDAAKLAHSTSLAASAQRLAEARASLDKALRDQTLDRGLKIEAARKRLSLAQAAVKDLGKSKGNLARPLEILGGSTVGSTLGTTMLNALGLPGSELMHGAVGSLMGALTPVAIRTIAAAGKRPAVLKLPLVGAVGGNALSP